MRRTIFKTATAVGAMLVLTGLNGTANAQSMDYGSLELLFGETVTTSATGKPQRASEVPVAMTIVTQDDIRRSGAMDIPGILRRYAGIDVKRYSAGQAEVGIRGYNEPYSPKLLVLVNGRQVYLDHYGATIWETIPVALDEIRQIEVVKGPNSALFGFNAASGVINILTYSPKYDDRNSATVYGGNNGERGASIVQTMRGDDYGVRFSAKGAFRDEFDEDLPAATAAAISADDEAETRAISIDSRFQLMDNLEVGVEATSSRVEELNVIPSYISTIGALETYSLKFNAIADTSYGQVSTTAYRNNLQTGGFNNDISVIQLQDLFKIGTDHAVRLAAEYRRNENKQETGAFTIAGVSTIYNDYAVSAMWDWSITDDLSWTNAVRHDTLKLKQSGSLGASPFTLSEFDRDIKEFSYNSGLVYRLSDTQTLRASAARGVQAPSLIEFGITPAGFFSGNPYIEPTIVENYEIGYDHVFSDYGKAGISLFLNKSKDVKGVFGTVPDVAENGATYFLFDNRGDSDMQGVELSFDANYDENWRWGANYTYINIDDDLTVNNGGVLTHEINYEDGQAEHKINVYVGYSNERWEADLYAVYSSDYTDFGSEAGLTGISTVDIDDYVNADARIAYKVDDGVQIALKGENIFTSEQRQTSVGKVERRVWATVNLAW